MPIKSVSMKDLAREVGEYNAITLKKQQGAVAKAMAHAIPVLVAASPVDTGLYAQSWDFNVDERRAVIGNYAPHAAVIESGARPFRPPIGPLLGWAKRVLKDPSQPPGYSPAVWSLARGTQKKIEREGLKPHHILENAIPRIIEEIKRELVKIA